MGLIKEREMENKTIGIRCETRGENVCIEVNGNIIEIIALINIVLQTITEETPFSGVELAEAILKRQKGFAPSSREQQKEIQL